MINSSDCNGADNESVGFQVSKHLLDQDHRDIVLFFPPTQFNDRASDRLAGVLRALRVDFEQLSKNRFIETLYDIGAAKEAVSKLLSEDRPTALVCGNDIIAQGAIYACHAMRVKIPGDISIVGIGDFRGSAHIEPGLTTVRLPAREIGMLAAERLCKIVDEGAVYQPKNLLVPATLIIRNSVATRD